MSSLVEVRAPLKSPSEYDPTQVPVAVARNVYSPKIGVVSKRPGFARQLQSQYRGPVSLLALPSGVCGYIREGLLLFSGETGDWDPAGPTPWGGAAGGNGGIILAPVPSDPLDPVEPAEPELPLYPNDEFDSVSGYWNIEDANRMVVGGGDLYADAGISEGIAEWYTTLPSAPYDEAISWSIEVAARLALSSVSGGGQVSIELESSRVGYPVAAISLGASFYDYGGSPHHRVFLGAKSGNDLPGVTEIECLIQLTFSPNQVNYHMVAVSPEFYAPDDTAIALADYWGLNPQPITVRLKANANTTASQIHYVRTTE